MPEPLPEDMGQYWALLGKLPTPVFVHDFSRGGELSFLNIAAIEAFGYNKEDLATFDIATRQVFPDPDYREKVLKAWWAAVGDRRKTGRMAPLQEERITDKYGRTRNVLAGFALYDPYIIVTLQDVTKERTAEAATEAERRRHERKAYLATEHMPGGAYSITLPEGASKARFSFVSTAFCDMMGVSREEVASDIHTAFAHIHPEDRAYWSAQYDKALATQSYVQVEGRLLSGPKERWVCAEAMVRTTAAGETIWDGLVVDITELRETEERLTAVLSAADAFTWQVDLGSGQITFDMARVPHEGFATDELSLSIDRWFEGVHPDDLVQSRIAYHMLIKGEIPKLIHVYRRKISANAYIWLRLHAGISARDEAGMPLALSGVTFDVTAEMEAKLRVQEEQAQLREDLQRAQQRDTIAQVAGGVAHDLNNLFAVISGTVEMLENPSVAPEAANQGLYRIRRALGMARDLISGLGRVSRPDLPRRPQDLRKMLADGIELLGSRRMVRHNVHLALPAQDLTIWANPTEIAQVVVNLALNACESGGPEQDATVQFTILAQGTRCPNRPPDLGALPDPGARMAMFTVRDTGAGISEEVRAHMFRPNFTTKGSAGTGLGLLIVGNILKANHAALWVESSLGAGSVFTVAWPMDPPIDHPTALPAPAHRPRNGREAPAPDMLAGLRVLVLDDLQDVAEVLMNMLDGAGAMAFAESDPQEAQAILSEMPAAWSVLVTDLHMPGIDGLQMARFAARLNPPIPTVLITARPETLDSIMRAEFAAVLSKPVSGMELAQAVLRAAPARGVV
jgi:PAS domain S-box-containing protein